MVVLLPVFKFYVDGIDGGWKGEGGTFFLCSSGSRGFLLGVAYFNEFTLEQFALDIAFAG